MLFRVLALDLGKKRIGLAVSDPLGVTAQGRPTYSRVNLRSDLLAIHLKAREVGAVAILMGLPKSLQGEEARQAQWVRDFGNRLRERSGLPVFYWDERFTSVEAERVLQLHRSRVPAGKARILQKGRVDRLAAVLLLQSFLDAGMPGLAPEEGSAEDPESDVAVEESEPLAPVLPSPAEPDPGGRRRHRERHEKHEWDDDPDDARPSRG